MSFEREGLADALFPTLTVLCHPDPDRVGERAVLIGEGADLSRLEPLFAQPRGAGPQPLADPHLSRRPLRLTFTSESATIDADGCSTPLTADGEPLTAPRTFTAEDLEDGVVLVLARRITLLLHLTPTLTPFTRDHGLVGESASIARVRAEIERVADLDFPVLLRGESGTGKELVARALHEAGPRRERPYLAVNMGAIPPTLAAAELFGAAKGAYSGADRNRRGYFERARGGTLFLDEVGEAPADVQVMLLRALETGQIQPVGAQEPETVDVRVVSATDVDLEAAIADGRFRSPLLHRLAGFEIALPPLRHRREDFGRLFFGFLRQELAAMNEGHRLLAAHPDADPWVPAELVARLARHAWPGNVRQLKNVVRQLAVTSRGQAEMQLAPSVAKALTLGRLPARASTATPRPTRPSYREPVDVGEEELTDVLAAHGFEVKAAAAALGVSRTSLYELMQRFGLRRASELEPDELEGARLAHGNDLDAMAADLRVSRPGLKRRLRDLGLR